MQTTLSDHVRNNRGSGLTTYLALVTLAQAIGNPESWVQVKDHHDSGAADRELHATVAKVARELGIKLEVRSTYQDEQSTRLEHFIKAQKRGRTEEQYVRR